MSNFCRNCGGALKTDAGFCVFCGSAVKRDEPSQVNPGTQAPNNYSATFSVDPEVSAKSFASKPRESGEKIAKMLENLSKKGFSIAYFSENSQSGGRTNLNQSGINQDMFNSDDDDTPFTNEDDPDDPDTNYDKLKLGGMKSGGSGFAGSDWKKFWRKQRKSAKKLGIILTYTSPLKSPEKFSSALNNYIAKKKAAGIEYHVLDLGTQMVGRVTLLKCEQIVAMLKKVYRVAVPDYLLIIGDYYTIPCKQWRCLSPRDNKVIPSDLPYITLSTISPWLGIRYKLSNSTKVGRIPTSAVNNFAEAVEYLNFTADYKPYSGVKGYGYSAESWSSVSSEVVNGKFPFGMSPTFTSEPALASKYGFTLISPISPTCNLLYFNLHGAEVTHSWYGETSDRRLAQRMYNNRDSMLAFNRNLLPQKSGGYAVMTEACYGAKPFIYKNDKSILVHALTNGCVAFVGSTTPAWGGVGTQMVFADVLAHFYLKYIQSGRTAGDSYILALNEVMNWPLGGRELKIKTWAQFFLYGDPSVTLVANHGQSNYSSFDDEPEIASAESDPSLAVKFVSVDELSRSGMSTYSTFEQEAIQKIANTFRDNASSYMATNYSSWSDEKPEMFKVDGDGYRMVYTKVENGVEQNVYMTADDKGNVTCVAVSR